VKIKKSFFLSIFILKKKIKKKKELNKKKSLFILVPEVSFLFS